LLTKRAIIAALAGVNLFLMAALILGSYSLPEAHAQAARPSGRAGDFVAVTAQAPGQSYDVLWLLDVDDRRLHAFYPQDLQSRRLGYGGFRELQQDFRSN
jgi:hypothetical protein